MLVALSRRNILAAMCAFAIGCTPAAAPQPPASTTATAAPSASPTVTPIASGTARRTPSPQPATLAVIENQYPTLAAYQQAHPLALVRADGSIVTTVVPARPRVDAGNVYLPMTSASVTRVYYLDGNATLMALAADGSKSAIRDLAVSANERAVFAVSPDDGRVAVTIVAYGLTDPRCQTGCVPTASYHLYVEDLRGGGRVELAAAPATSDGKIRYPVAWVGGRLVVAEGPYTSQNVLPQYFGTPYHVTDPATGKELAVVGADCVFAGGPVSAAGIACADKDGHLITYDWAGARRDMRSNVDVYAPERLSPDGSLVAGTDHGMLVIRDASGTARTTTVRGDPVGWMGPAHVVCYVTAPAGDDAPSLVVLDIGSGDVTPIALPDAFRGTPGLRFFHTLPTLVR